MKYGLFSTDQANSRSELVKNVMCKDGPTEEERQNLKHYYYFEKYTNYATRISVVPVLYLLYKKRFFDKKSPFFIREIVAAAIGISYIGGCDLLASEYMWKNCYPIVKKYNNIMDSYYDAGSSQKMRKNEYRQSEKEKLYD